MTTFDPWIKRFCGIDRNFPIHRMTIPGTHDSGTKSLGGDSKTQDTTLDEQLAMGVRYLDIRLDSSESNLPVVHGNVFGSGNTDLVFSDVADSCCKFLTGASGLDSTEETIFLQVKSDRGPDPGMHDQVIQTLKDSFPAGEQYRLQLGPLKDAASQPNPNIGGVSGKLVLMRRYMLDSNVDRTGEAGTPVHSFASGSTYNDWAGSTSTDPWPVVYENNKFEWPGHTDNKDYMGGTLIDYRNRFGQSFIIQDWYNTSNTASKWTLVEQYLNYANQSDSPDSWFLNFSSCASPESSANAINPQLQSYFANNATQHGFGTVLMDFVNWDLVRAVYGANGL